MKVGQTARIGYVHKDSGTLLCEVTVTRRRGFFDVSDMIRGTEILGSLASGRKFGTLDSLFPAEIQCYATNHRGFYRREIFA